MGPTIAGAIGEAIRVQRGTLLAPPAPHILGTLEGSERKRGDVSRPR